jgi:hypothetical protein
LRKNEQALKKYSKRRTFGLIQAAPYEKEQASFERLLDGLSKRAVGDQTSPAPERVRASLEGSIYLGGIHL